MHGMEEEWGQMVTERGDGAMDNGQQRGGNEGRRDGREVPGPLLHHFAGALVQLAD